MSAKLTYLNLGCGNRYHTDWINIDISPSSPDVIKHDLNHGIPLPDASCDVVYHAAVLEHMRRFDAVVFMAECYRVLKPGGIVRVGVPDLEKTCKLYLSKLNAVLNGDKAAVYDYDWMMLELFDQTVREVSGGEMLNHLRQNPIPNESFIIERIGEEGRQFVRVLKEQNEPQKNLAFFIRLRRGLRKLPHLAKRLLLQWLLGPESLKAFDIGHFRLSGESHQWMYDRYSLSRLLNSTGFCDVLLCKAGTSKITDWSRFHLDILPNGQVIKPDLFFIEAVKSKGYVYEGSK